MKLFLSILFFVSTAFAVNTVIEIYELCGIELGVVDTSGENNSEKEPTETGEDDTKIEVSSLLLSLHQQGLCSKDLSHNLTMLGGYIMELSDPPPELS